MASSSEDAEAGIRQISELKAAIHQRDSLLRIVNGEDTGEPLEQIPDNPNAPIMTRIRNLSKLLKERDVVLQRAASEADEVMKTPTPHVKVPAHYAESKSVPITSGPIMPAKVQRPSWMAAADHAAGGDRLRASLQATDERYAEQYRQQQQRSQVMAGDATVSDKSHFPAVATMTPQDTRASRARTSGSSRMPSSKDWDSQVPVVIEWQTTGAQQELDLERSSARPTKSNNPLNRAVLPRGVRVDGSIEAERGPSGQLEATGEKGRGELMERVEKGRESSSRGGGDGPGIEATSIYARVPPAPRNKTTWHTLPFQQVAPLQTRKEATAEGEYVMLHLPPNTVVDATGNVVSATEEARIASPRSPQDRQKTVVLVGTPQLPQASESESDETLHSPQKLMGPVRTMASSDATFLGLNVPALLQQFKSKRGQIRDILPKLGAAGMAGPLELPSRVALQDAQQKLVSKILGVLDAQDESSVPFDRVHFDNDLLKDTIEYLIVRENEVMEAVRQIKERDELLKVQDMKMTTLVESKDVLKVQIDRLNATVEELSTRLLMRHEELAEEKRKRIPPDPGKLYAREDHLRTLEELEDSKAQLVELNEGLASLQHQLSGREEQLAIATQNLNAVQQDRTRVQRDVVEMAKKLGEAEESLVVARRELVETRESLEARISSCQRDLHDLEARFNMDRELMMAKEAQLLQEKAALLKAQGVLREDMYGRETSSIDQMGDATAKLEAQEVELKVLRLRVQEVEMLMVEQQDTLDRLIADAMAEVAKREQEWLSVRTHKDTRIEALEVKLRDVREAERTQHERASEYEHQFRAMEDDYCSRLAEQQGRFDKMKANLEYCIELQKKEFKEHFEGQIKSAKDAQERDQRQRKQITELLQQKAWLQRQMGLPEIIA